MNVSVRPPERFQKLALWFAFFAAPLSFLLMMYFLDRPYEVADEYRVQPASYMRSFSPVPPPDGWEPFNGTWPEGRASGEPFTSVWYRYEIPAPRVSTMREPVFYIIWASANLDIWFAGERQFRTAEAERPLYEQNEGVLVALDSANGKIPPFVYVRVTREYADSRLSLTYVSPRAFAQQDADAMYLVARTIPTFMLVIMGTFGLLVALMFYLRREKTAYGFYALMLFLWAIHTGHEFVAAIPFNRFLWACISYASVTWLTVELYFVNRYFLTPNRRQERVVLIISLLVVAVIVLASLAASYSVVWSGLRDVAFLVTNSWFFLVAIIVTSRYYVAVKERFNFERASLFIASGLVIVVGLRDIFYESVPEIIPGTTFYLQFAVLVPLSMFGVQLIRRFAHDSRLAEARYEELKVLAREQGDSLEKTTRKLSQEERRRVLAEERARLMRDMHDGLGGQLVHALALSEQGDDTDLQRSLRLALDDLRLIVDSLSPTEDGIGDLLASYRHRVGKLLRRNGFEITWDLEDDALELPLPPNASLSVLRIIQEALTNAVRHSGGKHLHVAVSKRERHIEVAIEDDGVGIPEDVSERGLVNMRVRATEIGGALAVKGDESGTRVALLLPLIADDSHSS